MTLDEIRELAEAHYAGSHLMPVDWSAYARLPWAELPDEIRADLVRRALCPPLVLARRIP